MNVKRIITLKPLPYGNLVNSGFSAVLATVKLHFAIVIRNSGVDVFVFHGTPSDERWFTVLTPVATFANSLDNSDARLRNARAFVDVMCNQVGAWAYFPHYSLRWDLASQTFMYATIDVAYPAGE